MVNKIEAFFTQQANSSVLLLWSVPDVPVCGDVVSSLSNPLSQPTSEKNEKELRKDGKFSPVKINLTF